MTSVVDTGNKFSTSLDDTSDNFITGVNNTGEKKAVCDLSPVSLTPVINL